MTTQVPEAHRLNAGSGRSLGAPAPREFAFDALTTLGDLLVT
ncbi:hypothetical protein ACWDOP_36385 [Nocardia sp. NPDC003693]